MRNHVAAIVVGIVIIAVDIYGISVGRLPLKGIGAIEITDYPPLFWGYAIVLGALGLTVIVWGLTRLARARR